MTDISHKKNDGGTKLLVEHLREVAAKSEKYAAKFGAEDWGRTVGLLHDLGKFHEEFQAYIRKPDEEKIRGEVNHSSAGAIWACQQYEEVGKILAFIIAGHHAGLPDWDNDISKSCLKTRLEEGNFLLDETMKNSAVNEYLESVAQPHTKVDKYEFPSLWIRLLFSCLVDADFLATEEFMKPQNRGDYSDLSELRERLNKHLQSLNEKSQANPTDINAIRQTVQEQCRRAGRESGGGLFTLTVPTGGGKTLSSMLFALEHAKAQKKERIIYAIPYTSIIEQNAKVFKDIFGDGEVVEHHSNIQQEEDSENIKSLEYKRRLACENWDAPIIVTTNVQFFESLFAARTGRCRKLHNIVNSVVILDEAQMLPAEFLEPILRAIRELSEKYNVSFVLCTATQPAFDVDKLKKVWNDPPVKEICQSPEQLAKKLERVAIHTPPDINVRCEWADMAAKLIKHESVLCIVNSRKDCRELYDEVKRQANDAEEIYHLSALMCGKHRSDWLDKIKKRLKNKQPTKVISTSLIEAGVDIDFPVVYRALAGLDSIAQAAGRCNREGGLNGCGQVHIFRPPKQPPPGLMKKGFETACGYVEEYGGQLLSPDTMRDYFREYYNKCNSFDRENIMEMLDRLSFREAAEKFTLIESGQKPVIVPYGDHPKKLIKRLCESSGAARGIMRELQPFTVNVYEKKYQEMEREELIKDREGVAVLTDPSGYSLEYGLDC